jgi:hypothetical protein
MKYILFAFCISINFAALASGQTEENFELRKKINKTFECPLTKTVEVTNTYGNITLVVYNGTQIKYDIEVISKADSKSKAQKELDRVNVVFNDTASKTAAKTTIEDKSSWFGWNWSWSGNTEIQINYTIYLPDNRSLSLNQTYGNVYLPNYSGPIDLEVAYGTIEGADLSNTLKVDLSYGQGKLGCIKNSKLNVDYSDIIINSAAKLTMELQYGKLTVIESCESLTIDADYSEITLGNGGKLAGNGGYNHYQVASAGDVEMSNEYGDISIQTLKGNLIVDSDYHTTKIETIKASVKSIKVNGDYSTLKLNSADEGYTYNISGSYNTVKAPNSNSDEDEDDNDNDKTVKGVKKGGKSNTFINVTGDYIHVSLK